MFWFLKLAPTTKKTAPRVFKITPPPPKIIPSPPPKKRFEFLKHTHTHLAFYNNFCPKQVNPKRVLLIFFFLKYRFKEADEEKKSIKIYKTTIFPIFLFLYV